MDFQPQIKQIYEAGTPMPFFMAYPDYPCIGKRKESQENGAYQDFEYFRRTYPSEVAKWQRRVEEILDKMDYEGSMIYDEFPDRVSLRDLSDAVARILSAEANGGEGFPRPMANGGEGFSVADEAYASGAGEGTRAEKSEESAWLKGLSQVLVCNEIYRRRQKRKQGANGRITKDFGYGIE